MPFEITGIYASLLAIILIVLSARVSIMRAQTDIPLLHGDNIALAERIRKHGNFTESVPMALILMGIVEAAGGSALWLNAIGGTLLISRIIHPFGINADNKNRVARGLGATLTAVSLLISVVFIALHVI
jgi:hypothetical protein